MQCSPTYNFYNCCGSAAGASGDTPNGGIAGMVFPLLSSMPDTQANWLTGDLMWAAYEYRVNPGLGSTQIFNPMQFHPFPYRLRDISFVKFMPIPPGNTQPGTTTKTMKLDIVVMDTGGNLQRVLSNASVDVTACPAEVWQPVPLTADPALRIIALGEVTVARFTISAPNNDTWKCYGLTSGRGEYV